MCIRDRFGTATAKKITPGGVVPGAIVHNRTTDKIQVRESEASFKNLSPIVAFATIDGGNIVSAASTGLTLTNNSNDADFTLVPNLQSANYTVIVSNNGTPTYTVLEANKSASEFKVTFSSAASSKTYSVMVLQV